MPYSKIKYCKYCPNKLANPYVSKVCKKCNHPFGEKNHAWKGDKVGYHGIHVWLKSRLGNPPYCELCKVKGKKSKDRWNIQWCNIDHKYRRILEDYIGLCTKCHYEFDKVYNKSERLRKWQLKDY